MKFINEACSICHQDLFYKFSKFSDPLKKSFEIYECRSCRNWQIYPLPNNPELTELYENNYFGKRTNRGYDDYAGETVKRSVISTLEKNLGALNFYAWEKNLATKDSLEIGAAAGHFVEYLQMRGWNSVGIDISKVMTEAAAKKGLKIIHGNFLEFNFKKEKFDLIALWATLEHLPEPDKFIEKISELLKPGGRLYLTTTNTGFWARIYGKNWRYINVPEHIYYFNKKSLAQLFEKSGLKIVHSFTYGSGFTTKKDASVYFRTLKFSFDKIRQMVS